MEIVNTDTDLYMIKCKDYIMCYCWKYMVTHVMYTITVLLFHYNALYKSGYAKKKALGQMTA